MLAKKTVFCKKFVVFSINHYIIEKERQFMKKDKKRTISNIHSLKIVPLYK